MGQLVGTLWTLGAWKGNISHGGEIPSPYNALAETTWLFYTKNDLKKLFELAFTNLKLMKKNRMYMCVPWTLYGSSI